MADELGSDTIPPDMPPSPDHKGLRSGEWPVMKDIIESTIQDAVKKAMDGDSDIVRGADVENRSREDMHRLVTELKSSMVNSVGDLRQQLFDRLNETCSDLKIMVREEMGPLRVQVSTLEITVRDFQESLHQGDTRFAVIGSKMDTMQGEIDRVRDTPTAMRKVVKDRSETTDKHSKPPGEAQLTRSPLMTLILVAILTAIGTTVGTWGMDLLSRGAKDAVKDAVKDPSAVHPPAPASPRVP